MGTFKRGKVYWIDYTADGKRYRESTGVDDKKLAEKVLAKRKVEIAEDKFLDKQRIERVSLEEFISRYLETHSRRKACYYTDCKITQQLRKFFGNKFLDEITIRDIEKFKTERMLEVKPATVNRALAVLKSMFNRAIEWKNAKENPCRSVEFLDEENERLRYLEVEQVEKLLAACQASQSDELKYIVSIALNTGMRKSEILNLKWSEIDMLRRNIRIMKTKNKDVKNVPINDALVKVLDAIPKNENSGYLFCGKDGKPIKDIKKSFSTAIKKSGIIDFHFHDLRHTFASQLAMSGVDLNTIRVLLGHKDLKMTMRYSHLSDEHTKRAVNILSHKFCHKSDTVPENQPSTSQENIDNAMHRAISSVGRAGHS